MASALEMTAHRPIAPLTGSQLGILMHAAKLGYDESYNVCTVVKFGSAPDPAVLRAAVEDVARHQQALRVVIRVDADGVPYQEALERGRVLEVLDVGPYAGALALAVRSATRQPIDLFGGPLVRVRLLRAGTSAVLVVVAHHVVFDGASAALYVENLCDAYRCQLQGTAWSSQAGDWLSAVSGLRRTEDDAATAGHPCTEFWRSRFAGREHIEQPPPVTGRGGMTATENGAVTFGLDAVAVRELSRACRTTPVVAHLTVLGRMVGRLLGRTDPLFVGLDVSARRRQTRGTIGHFVNVVPVSLPCATVGLRADLKTVSDEVRSAAAHSDLPLGALLRAGGVMRSDPISVIAACDTGRIHPDMLGDVPLTSVEQLRGRAKYGLSVRVTTAAADAAEQWDRVEVSARGGGGYESLLAAVPDAYGDEVDSMLDEVS